jgi:hypothetical protein
MGRTIQRDVKQNFAQEMVEHFRFPSDPSDRYSIIQDLPETVTLQLFESGMDLPMPPKERTAILQTEYADVIEKLEIYGCASPIELLLSFNPLDKGCEAVRRATSKQVRAFISLFEQTN